MRHNKNKHNISHTASEWKYCPFCGKERQQGWKVCPFCGKWFSDSGEPSAPVQAVSRNENENKAVNSSSTHSEVPAVRKDAPNAESVLSNNLMIAQLAAYYVEYGDEIYRKEYLEKTEALGIDSEEALNLFKFECDVCKKYNKKQLLDPKYVKTWVMGLRQPVFADYPQTQEEICKEFFLTLGELSKIMDEAEWHFWNSHELPLSDEVWREIFNWRIQDNGGMYAVKTYMPAVSEKYSVSMDSLYKVVNHYGKFLSIYKWG